VYQGRHMFCHRPFLSKPFVLSFQGLLGDKYLFQEEQQRNYQRLLGPILESHNARNNSGDAREVLHQDTGGTVSNFMC